MDQIPFGQRMETSEFDTSKLKEVADSDAQCLIIVGPNGVGKGTVINDLLSQAENPVNKIVRTTSRPKGDKELNGVDYSFVTNEEFLEMVAQGKFIEWSKYGQGFYGTTVDSVIEAIRINKNVVLDIDIDGAVVLRNALERSGITCVDVFLSPVSQATLEEENGIDEAVEVLSERITKRSRGEASGELQGRLRNAKPWLKRFTEFRYIIENKEGNINYAVNEIRKLLGIHIES